jgi:hypothetical protein
MPRTHIQAKSVPTQTVVAMRRSWVVAAAAPASAFLLSPASAFLLSPGAARQRGCAPSPFSCRAWKVAESDTPGVLYSTARSATAAATRREDGTSQHAAARGTRGCWVSARDHGGRRVRTRAPLRARAAGPASASPRLVALVACACTGRRKVLPHDLLLARVSRHQPRHGH